ncbi:hypothetical protein DesyoDRAFT_2070 [Desulfosporosinus youngiae DSM 17734]|uniref:Uncharacterized protein n=1 Tax=Desulfosporosinus youngiae DSM 17734 TaxID=768710 RepID=H5XU68_9FIRM|nr:hypothetical protein DesyoDRAFT_2070 [Desulfosporosinus youngiae DSM 17734]
MYRLKSYHLNQVNTVVKPQESSREVSLHGLNPLFMKCRS